MTWYLDAFFDRREGGIEVIGACTNGPCRATGSFPPRTLAGDLYHVGWSHLSAIETAFSSAGIGQGFDPRRDVDGVAIEVVVLDDHVAEVDATAEASEGTITS
jgi:hypothetical protein